LRLGEAARISTTCARQRTLCNFRRNTIKFYDYALAFFEECEESLR
jgi:hypothetical protein